MCCPPLPVCSFIHLTSKTKSEETTGLKTITWNVIGLQISVQSDLLHLRPYCRSGNTPRPISPPHLHKQNIWTSFPVLHRQKNCCRISVKSWLERIHGEWQEVETHYSKRSMSGICVGMKKRACRWHWVWPYRRHENYGNRRNMFALKVWIYSCSTVETVILKCTQPCSPWLLGRISTNWWRLASPSVSLVTYH